MANWFTWSTAEAGELPRPERIRRLPRGCLVSADGQWAELCVGGRVVAVYVQLGGRVAAEGRRSMRREEGQARSSERVGGATPTPTRRKP
jgi:hypothetical protein